MTIGPSEVEIEVKAIGVNFMDGLISLGRVNKKTIGGECSGIVSKTGVESGFKPGDRVCAAIHDCYRTFARSPSTFMTRCLTTYLSETPLPSLSLGSQHIIR